MLYVILEKDLTTDLSKVHSVFDDEQLAVSEMETLIESTEEDYGYKMISVPQSSYQDND